MPINNVNVTHLPMLALNEIPTPAADAKQITALMKQGGRVQGYQLSDGTVINKYDAVQLAKQGGIRGVGIALNRGNEYLKSLPDGNESTNLSNLPSISAVNQG
ncbi:MAG: DUF3892 domain-containing protein [Oscillospiraceae bacterium]|jgi:hypothetical protein|nr:DUF3892 domain-containing protein [Oscillospiraceae bacterium]